MPGTVSKDAIDRLLTAMEDLQKDVREVREEGRDRQDVNTRATNDLKDAIVRMEKVVTGHTAELGGQGMKLVELGDSLEHHYRLIMALTEGSASNSTLLATHAQLITTLGEAIIGAKDRARDAMRSAEDLRKFTDEFQSAVTRHVSEQTQAIQRDMEGVKTDMGSLKESNVTQDVKLVDLSVSTSAIVGALELQTQVEQARKGLPPDRKDRTALDTLRSKGQGTLIASIVGCILIALKIAHEVLSQGHVLPTPPVAPAAVQTDTKAGKP